MAVSSLCFPDGFHLNLVHLYPHQLNMYGDRGNVQALWQRATRRGIPVKYHQIHPNQPWGLSLEEETDLYFIGGGQDRQQSLMIHDLTQRVAPVLHKTLQSQQIPMLAICGGYQLLGQYYRSAEGDTMDGIGLLPFYTVSDAPRLIGNVVLETLPESPLGVQTLIGFENHGGRTYLEDALTPLGTVVYGHGNNGEDRKEGVWWHHVVGTYLHGALLPKNPALCDYLLCQAYARATARWQASHTMVEAFPPFPSLDHTLESQAHQAAYAHIKLLSV
ncbi:MAG: type 1 glutamine amidotransferase [Vampirovibrionales bacterium]